jgi:hypothetical protein
MFSSFNNKAICAVVSIVLIVSLLALPAAASIKPDYAAYEYGEAYKTSNYYDQLLDAKSKLTGDHRYDVILIALSGWLSRGQLGCRHGRLESRRF